jgi:hypothetical protein
MNHLTTFSYGAETKGCVRLNITATCSEGPGVEYRPENLVSGVSEFLAVSVSIHEFLVYCLKIGGDSYVTDYFRPITLIVTFDDVQSDS